MDKKAENEMRGYLNGLTDEELILIHNEYCREISSEDEIYDNEEEFFQTFFEGKVIGAVRACKYGEYNFTDRYVKFNGYANLESFNYIKRGETVFIDEIVDYAIENDNDFGNEILREMLDGEYQEEDADFGVGVRD